MWAPSYTLHASGDEGQGGSGAPLTSVRRSAGTGPSIPGQDPFHPFNLIGGTFTRFSDAEIVGRYPSRDRYVRRVKCAADHLAAKRYITFKDRNALIAAAKVEPLPLPPTDDDGNDVKGGPDERKPVTATRPPSR